LEWTGLAYVDPVSLTERVLAVLNQHDPEGLLAMPDVPPDEYKPEAADFAARLARGQVMNKDVVVEVWEHWFGPGSGFVTYSADAAVSALAADLDRLRHGRGCLPTP
jgi:hypothetical protein